MRIEDITELAIRKAHKDELYALRIRFVNYYAKHASGVKKHRVGTFGYREFFNKYFMLINEMKRRGLKLQKLSASRPEGSEKDRIHSSEMDLDVFRKEMFGLLVEHLDEIVVTPDYASITGTFVQNPKHDGEMELILKEAAGNIAEGLESKLIELIKKETKKEVTVRCEADGTEGETIPVFDLKLVPKPMTVRKSVQKADERPRAEIKKPEVTENYIRIPVGAECEVTATLTLDEGKGVKALYCGKEKRIRTYLFDNEKWTMAEAKAWIEEHKEKINKKLDDTFEDFEYLIHHIEIKDEKEVVHHCYLLDHIGNLFEQSHLWIDKGKVYLDGKEVKEGYFHIIKGLESTQEVAWSEEDAEKAKIKPKQMKMGMTLKEKAKEW